MNEVAVNVLDENGADALATFSKAILGSLPFAGSVFAEVIGTLIPNQRIDRMAEFLKILDAKLKELGKSIDDIKDKMTSEEYINLFEEGVWQSARSSSRERKEYIASILVNGLTDENLNEIQKNVFMNILNQLNDIEILMLYSHTMKMSRDKQFFEKHKDELLPLPVHIGSNREEIDKATIHKTYKDKLLNLNLLTRKFSNIKKGEMPEFDNKTGMMKSNGYELTSLGRLFLKYIDLDDVI